jgi:uncharacterized protein (DUF1810 family)
MDDPFDLQRFVAAQDAGGAYVRALSELRGGAKRTHWMWFVLPQLAGLGASPMAVRYGIGSLEEARAYLEHPILGSRLMACVQAMNDLPGLTAHAVLGSPDDMKFRSCLTLFAAAAPDEPAFADGLRRYYGGQPDPATLRLLAAAG